jgi:excisionase family DNA binding protein
MYKTTSYHPLMTNVEAAETLRVSKSTINNWLVMGKLQRVKMGGKTFLRRTEVEGMLIDALQPTN